jgi:DNA (cytosine-5)-methyltransferase 1
VEGIAKVLTRVDNNRENALTTISPAPGLREQLAFYNWLPGTPQPAGPRFRFIDLFAGIGGTRLAFQQAGGQCVFSSEWDKYAQRTYVANFGEVPAGDIRAVLSDAIPAHDVLVAGFPCQPFSIAGVSKKTALGRPHGFLDETQGTLFHEIARILRDRRPQAFLLENVRNLLHHDQGRTIATITAVLKELNYTVHVGLLNARRLLPQNRERVYIAGFLDPRAEFSFPEPPDAKPRLSSILESDVDARYTLTDHLWSYLQEYAEKHRRAGNGFGYGLADPDGVSRTLSARYYKDGSEILVPQTGRPPRRLTPRECARLMGFPDDFVIPVSDTQAYKQFGNAVVVPVIEAIAKAMRPHLLALKAQTDNDRQIAMVA